MEPLGTNLNCLTAAAFSTNSHALRTTYLSRWLQHDHYSRKLNPDNGPFCYDAGMRRAAGFVMAGGRSSRMGEDKTRLKVRSHFLVEIVAREVARAAGGVTLIGKPESFADLPFECLPDLRPGLGPLGGLEAALASQRAELNLIAGCDMPDIQFADLTRLLNVAEESKALCVMTRDACGRRHPLCAVYRNDALPVVSAALDAGRLRLLELVEELKAVEVRIDTVLSNVNTPEEWAAWQAAQPV